MVPLHPGEELRADPLDLISTHGRQRSIPQGSEIVVDKRITEIPHRQFCAADMVPEPLAITDQNGCAQQLVPPPPQGKELPPSLRQMSGLVEDHPVALQHLVGANDELSVVPPGHTLTFQLGQRLGNCRCRRLRPWPSSKERMRRG